MSEGNTFIAEPNLPRGITLKIWQLIFHQIPYEFIQFNCQ